MAIDVKEMVEMVEEGYLLVEGGNYNQVLDYQELAELFKETISNSEYNYFIIPFMERFDIGYFNTPIVAEKENNYYVGKSIFFQFPFFNFSLDSTLNMEDNGKMVIKGTFEFLDGSGNGYCKHHVKLEDVPKFLVFAIKFIGSKLM